jgi:hypothetical protein
LRLPGRRELLAIPAAAIIVFVPMAVDFAKHPNHFMGRAAEVNIPGHALQKTLFMTRQTVDVGLNYGLRGDPMERHNMLGDPTRLQIFWWRVPGIEELARWADKRTAGTAPELHGAGLPVFDIITAIFFYLGVFVCAHRAGRGGWRELALLLWMAIGSLASILSYGAPNLLRMTILIPAVVAISGGRAERGCRSRGQEIRREGRPRVHAGLRAQQRRRPGAPIRRVADTSEYGACLQLRFRAARDVAAPRTRSMCPS